jgi:ABC-type uncharacterized transport system substrate-binding protein
MSALPPKADMCGALVDVRFGPKADSVLKTRDANDGLAANDPESQARKAAFLQGLRELGWTEGQNVRIDYRWGAGSVDVIRKHVAELIALAPDVTLSFASQATHALQQESRTIPIVFTQVPDPIGAGFVDNLARPGGNATGFTTFEYGIGAKWLDLLKQIAPGVRRVAVLRDPTNPAGSGQWGAIQSAASSAGVELTSISSRAATDELNGPSRPSRGSRTED